MKLSWILLGVIVAVAPAFALIRIDSPIPKIYAESGQVLVARINKIDPEKRLVDGSISEILKGNGALGERVLVQLAYPEDLIKQVRVGDQMIVLGGEKSSAIHVADTWLGAEPLRGKNVYRTRREIEEYRKSFPGSTHALVEILKLTKEGKSPLVNAAEDKVFEGGVKELGNSGVTKPTCVVAADLLGDGKKQIVVCGPEGLRVMDLQGKDLTEGLGLAGLRAHLVAAGDVNGDGKVDLVVGGKVMLNQGGKFAVEDAAKSPDDANLVALGVVKGAAFAVSGDGHVMWIGKTVSGEDRPLWQGGEKILSASIGQFGEDDGVYVMVTRESGITRYPITGGNPASITRLTGDKSMKAIPGATATGIDINGDGKLDYLAVSPEGGVLLVNRGYGAFLISLDVPKLVNGTGEKKLPFAFASSAVMSAADLAKDKFDDLIVVAGDGKVYELINPPHEVKK